jgi:SAM-dependent methyltransferase
MNERQKAELEFWRDNYEKHKGASYACARASNFIRIREHWPETPRGRGLDVGCGPCSIFQFSNLEIDAVDPLLEEYRKFYIPEEAAAGYVSRVVYHLGHKDDGYLGFEDSVYDYIFCINVIDHTEHWEELLKEMQWCLKTNGILYLQVNFDWELKRPEHVTLWNWKRVQEEMVPLFFPLHQAVEWDGDNQRFSYWGKWLKSASG